MGKPSTWFKSLRKAIQNHVNEDTDYLRFQHLPHSKRPGPSNQPPQASAGSSISDSSAATKEFFPVAETCKSSQSCVYPWKKLPVAADVRPGPSSQSSCSSSTAPSSADPQKRAPAIAVADVGAIVRNSRGTAGVRRMLEEWAAITIQTAFRGSLARQALASLKGLVRLQALARGHLVRRRMQTIVKVQAQMLTRRDRTSVNPKDDSNLMKPRLHSANLDYRSDDWEYGAHNMLLPTVRPNSKENATLKRLSEEAVPKGRVLVCAEELTAQAKDRQGAPTKRERALAYALLLTLTKGGTELDADD